MDQDLTEQDFEDVVRRGLTDIVERDLGAGALPRWSPQAPDTAQVLPSAPAAARRATRWRLPAAAAAAVALLLGTTAVLRRAPEPAVLTEGGESGWLLPGYVPSGMTLDGVSEDHPRSANFDSTALVVRGGTSTLIIGLPGSDGDLFIDSRTEPRSVESAGLTLKVGEGLASAVLAGCGTVTMFGGVPADQVLGELFRAVRCESGAPLFTPFGTWVATPLRDALPDITASVTYSDPTSDRSFSLEQASFAAGIDPLLRVPVTPTGERRVGVRTVRIGREDTRGRPNTYWQWQERPGQAVQLNATGLDDAELDKIVLGLRSASTAEWSQLVPDDTTATSSVAPGGCPEPLLPLEQDLRKVLPDVVPAGMVVTGVEPRNDPTVSSCMAPAWVLILQDQPARRDPRVVSIVPDGDHLAVDTGSSSRQVSAGDRTVTLFPLPDNSTSLGARFKVDGIPLTATAPGVSEADLLAVVGSLRIANAEDWAKVLQPLNRR